MRENMLYNPRHYQLRESQLSRMLEIVHNNKTSKLNGLLFFGDSITEQMNIEKYFPKHNLKYNCGIAGLTSEGLL